VCCVGGTAKEYGQQNQISRTKRAAAEEEQGRRVLRGGYRQGGGFCAPFVVCGGREQARVGGS
jgi:hypothetical protein